MKEREKKRKREQRDREEERDLKRVFKVDSLRYQNPQIAQLPCQQLTPFNTLPLVVTGGY